MIEKKETSDWFKSGRGGPQSLAKNVEGNKDIGSKCTEAGKKPVYPDGDSPFHSGSGKGRK